MTSCLDAVDHANALLIIAQGDTTQACRQATAASLATALELAATPLTHDDHTRQVVPLALQLFKTRILEATHRRTPATYDDVASIYRDHVQALYARRRNRDPK